MDCECYATKGIGETHAKWSPVCTAAYRMRPQITFPAPVTGEDAERHLRRCKQREQWCAEAAEQFGLAADALTRWERSAIARWHEDWGIGREMIEEALLRAGNKTTIRYVDGILRAWRAKGITTVAAARGQGQLSGSNILATERPAPQQPAAASAQQPLSSRDWMAMFDEEG